MDDAAALFPRIAAAPVLLHDPSYLTPGPGKVAVQAADGRDWAVSSKKGYTRRDRAVAACELLWFKLAGCSECPRIQVNTSSVPALADLFRSPPPPES